MRLRVSSLALLVALWLAMPGLAQVSGIPELAVIVSYPVGELGLQIDYGGIVIDKGWNVWFAARFLPDTVASRPALCCLDLWKGRVATYRLPVAIEEVGALAYDAPRNIIWFADSYGHRLCKFTIPKRILTVYDLPIQNGDLADIQSIDVDGYGNVFMALWESEAVGVFDPKSPTKLTVWSSDSPVVAPYSIDVEEDGGIAWFTAGEGDWTFGNLDLYPPLPDTSPDMNTWSSTTSDLETMCLRWDPAAGAAGKLFISADDIDTLAGQVGKFDPTDPLVLRHYGVCADEAGLYGIVVEPGRERAWVTEWVKPGALAEVDAGGDGIDPPVDLTQTTIEDVDRDVVNVPRPWVYQLNPKWCPIRENEYLVEDRCEGPDHHSEEFPISPFAQPGAIAMMGFDVDDWFFGIQWVTDTFSDTIVAVMEIPGL